MATKNSRTRQDKTLIYVYKRGGKISPKTSPRTMMVLDELKAGGYVKGSGQTWELTDTGWWRAVGAIDHRPNLSHS